LIKTAIKKTESTFERNRKLTPTLTPTVINSNPYNSNPKSNLSPKAQ